MDRSDYDQRSGHNQHCTLVASYTGAGAAPPVFTPSTVVPAADNFAHRTTLNTRSGVGVYVLFVGQKLPRFLSITPNVIGTDGKKVTVTASDVAAGSISVLAWTVAGVAVDLASTDRLTLTIDGRLSLA